MDSLGFSEEDIHSWIMCWEGQTLDFKSKGILSHPHDLAEFMVAFGNNKYCSEDFGGRIIIGVTDEKEIESFPAKQGHEENIITIARDHCSPSIRPNFEKVSVGNSQVYVITIPKMKDIPYQLITRNGKSHRIRVGSTIREPNPNELNELYDKTNFVNTENLEILTKFPQNFNSPYRHITIIPIDSNSKLIEFDVDNTKWLKDNSPQTVTITEKILKQNAIYYECRNFTSSGTALGILNDDGHYSLIEVLNEYKKIIHIERESTFLCDILENIRKIYMKFGYDQRIYIHYQHHNVQNYDFKTDDMHDKHYFSKAKFQSSDFIIQRTTSLVNFDSVALTNSILEEMARACNWPVNPGEFNSLVLKNMKSISL